MTSSVHLRARLVLLAALATAACGSRGDDPFVPPPPPQTTWALNIVTVAQSAVARLGLPGSRPGGRDDLGTMHLVWEEGSLLRHGFVSLTQTQWTLRTIPTVSSSATIRGPALVFPSGALFIAAWLEQLGVTSRIVVARSQDRGANWETPITLSFGTVAVSSPVIHAYRRANNTFGAVVAWSEPGSSSGRIMYSMWRGTGWSAADWTANAPLSTNLAGNARDVSISGLGENLIAAWADPRGATGGTGIFMARSSNGGQTWQSEGLIGIPIGTSGVGTEPSVAVENDGDVYIAWNTNNSVRIARSSDSGINFSAPRPLGPGFGPNVTTGDNDRIAVAWTGGNASDPEAQHIVSLALSLDDLVTVDGPAAMPGSASISARSQARAFLSGTALDMIWTDVTGGNRSIQHRTAALP